MIGTESIVPRRYGSSSRQGMARSLDDDRGCASRKTRADTLHSSSAAIGGSVRTGDT